VARQCGVERNRGLSQLGAGRILTDRPRYLGSRRKAGHLQQQCQSWKLLEMALAREVTIGKRNEREHVLCSN
jgi:hypothetical protein